MIRLGGDIAGVLARLKENTFELVEGKVIQWTNGASIEEQLHAFFSSPESILNMIANFSNAKKAGLVQLIAANGKNAQTVLQVFANEEVQRITAVATSPASSRTIIDFLTGKSSFMQRFSGGSSAFAGNRMNFGVAEVEFAGVQESVVATITHGLGEAPKVAFAFCLNEPASVGYITFETWELGATTFKARGRSSSAVVGPGKALVGWVAISG